MESLGYASFQTPGWTMRLRQCLAQFCDLFSEFGQNIAPSYHHDRCERSVQMRLYTLNKRHFFLVFVAFFICFGLTVLIGLAGPPITQTTQMNATSLVLPPSDFNTGPFHLQSPPELSTFHQQLWLIAEIITDFDGSGTFLEPFKVGVKMRGELQEQDHPADMEYPGIVHNRSRTLKCQQGACEELILLHLGFIDYPQYIITVNFYGLEKMKANIVDIKFFFKTYNPSFTSLEIWFRFVFLVFSFIATCLFAHGLRCFSMRDWSIEQKWMAALLPLLLLYDNPIFPLTFLVNSWVPGLIDALFQASFLGAMLLFWLCLYHGVRQNKRHFTLFYLPKLCVVGSIWLAAISMSTWQEYNTLLDPTFNYKLDSSTYMFFKIFFLASGCLYLLYLIYLLVRAYAELRSMPYFDLRLKFMTALMLIVLAITVSIYVLRFGGSVLQDNFVAELATHYQNSAEFLAFYGLLNFYLYTMAFVYSPSKNAVFESHFKDNPALSMLNDSDDDVIYGSDHEEMTALTTHRKGSSTRYDSEEEAFN